MTENLDEVSRLKELVAEVALHTDEVPKLKDSMNACMEGDIPPATLESVVSALQAWMDEYVRLCNEIEVMQGKVPPGIYKALVLDNLQLKTPGLEEIITSLTHYMRANKAGLPAAMAH